MNKNELNLNKVVLNVEYPNVSNILLDTYRGQLLDWTRFLDSQIDKINNSCILIYQTMLIIELLIIERFGIVGYEQEIDIMNFRMIQGSNSFKLKQVQHKVQDILKVLLNSKNILSHSDMEFLRSLDKKVKEMFVDLENISPNEYVHLRYNFNTEKIILDVQKKIDDFRGISKEVIKLVRL